MVFVKLLQRIVTKVQILNYSWSCVAVEFDSLLSLLSQNTNLRLQC